MQRKNSGISLIEVLVAIVLLAAVLTAATKMVGISINKIRDNGLRITGVYLAQEGIELTRNFRDSTAKSPADSFECFFLPNINQKYAITSTAIAQPALGGCSEVINNTSNYGVGIIPADENNTKIVTSKGEFTRTLSLTPYDLSEVDGVRTDASGTHTEQAYTATIDVQWGNTAAQQIQLHTLLTPWQN